MFEVVMMIGFERTGSSACAGMWTWTPGCGDVAREGPLGVLVLDRRSAGVDRDAAFARALARSGSCIMVVSRDRRDVRFGLESTRWKSSLSLTEDGPLCSSESSQSDESSSSSIALSEISSSSSSDSNTGLSLDAARPTATSSLNEVCFLFSSLPLLPFECFSLSDSELLYDMCRSNELSSSPDDVPIVNIGPFFFGCACW